MRPVRRILLPLPVAIAALATAAAPAPACGCGVALQAKAPREVAFLAGHNGIEDLVASFALSSSKPHAAVVLPVPNTPTVRLAPAGRDLFRYLAGATKPRRVTVPGPPPVAGSPGGGGGGGVTVVGHKTIGGYSVAVLKGGDAGALNAWLTGHGYTLPAGAQPILAQYLKQGWSFVAIRLAHKARGQLMPLRIRFHTPHLVYPMKFERLGTEPVTVDLYTIATHRLRVRGLSTAFAGPVSALVPAVPANLKRYLTGGILTRLKGTDLDPSTLRHDYQPVRAASDAPFRAVERVYTGAG